MTSNQDSSKNDKPGPACLSTLYRGLCWACAVLAVLTVVLAVTGLLGEDSWDAIVFIIFGLILGAFSGCFGAVQYSRLTASGSGKDADKAVARKLGESTRMIDRPRSHTSRENS